MINVSIVIPTYRRPELLAATLASCLAQQGIEDQRIEIVVVDNDPAQSARSTVDAAAARSGGIHLRYTAEPRPGISHARNTGVAQAAGRYVAFIDDDEEAAPGWLAAFLQTIRRTGADLAVGPVYPRFAAGADAYVRQTYTRDAQVPSGTPLERWGGIGNSLLDKERCFAGTSEPFDPRFGLSGGEDALFLHQLRRRGGTIVWCADAAVRESIPAAAPAAARVSRRPDPDLRLHRRDPAAARPGSAVDGGRLRADPDVRAAGAGAAGLARPALAADGGQGGGRPRQGAVAPAAAAAALPMTD
jgi:hypothetical protein